MSFVHDLLKIKKMKKKKWKLAGSLLNIVFSAMNTGKGDDAYMYWRKPSILGKVLTACLQMFAGVAGGFITFIAVGVNLLLAFWVGMPSIVGYILLLAIISGSVGLFARGWSTLSLLYRYQAVARELSGCSRMAIADLCRDLRRPLPELSKDLYKMIRLGLLPENCLNLERKELVLDPAGAGRILSAEEQKTVLRQHKKKSAAPFFLIGVIWLAYAVALLLYGSASLAWPIVLSAVTYLVSRRVFPDTVWLTLATRPEINPPLLDSENEEAAAFLQISGQHMSELTALSKAIDNEKVGVSLKELILIAKDIFAFVQKHPEKIGQMRQFMNYYLPMSVKLLNNYSDLEKQSQKGENIRKTMKEIEDVMGTVVNAFKKELDSLFENKAIDISADIAVMKNIMQMDKLEKDKAL